VYGGLAGLLAVQGKARSLVLGFGDLLETLAVGLLAAGVIALLTGQPYGVWYGLGLAGLIGVLVLPFNLRELRKRYREAEERRMQAEDL
jgi:hypothetical protein